LFLSLSHSQAGLATGLTGSVLISIFRLIDRKLVLIQVIAESFTAFTSTSLLLLRPDFR